MKRVLYSFILCFFIFCWISVSFGGTLVSLSESQTHALEGSMWEVTWYSGATGHTEYFIVGRHNYNMLYVFQDAISSMKGTGLVLQDEDTGNTVFDFTMDAPYNIGYGYEFQFDDTKESFSGFLETKTPSNVFSATFKRLYPHSTDSSSLVSDFVSRFYQECLNREPDSQGLKNWVGALNSGANTGAQVAKAFIFSEEFQSHNTTNSEFIEILYTAFFNRESDISGYNTWINALLSGVAREDVVNGFIESEEFRVLCGAYQISVY